MFKRNQPIFSNFYDETYKCFVNKRFTVYHELELAIHNCFVKEAISHLFPADTGSRAYANMALKMAREEVQAKTLDYTTALQKEQDYYNNNHTHFVACKDYINPNDLSVDLAIENIVRRAKGL